MPIDERMFLIKQICVDLDAKSWHENARGGKCLRWFLYIWLNIINHGYQRSILSLRLSKGCFETNWYDDDDHDDDGGGDDGGGGGGGFCSELTFGLFLLIFVSSVLYYLIGIPCNFQNSCNSKNYDICDLTNCHEDNDNNEKVCNILIIRLNYW